MVEQLNIDGKTVWWNTGTVLVEQCGGTVWWNNATVKVERCGENVEQ